MELDQDILNQIDSDQNAAVQQSTFVAAEKNPDKHAKVLTLAEKFGAKSDFVEQNYEQIAKQNERNEIDEKVGAATPKLKQFISNPDYAAVSKDDLDVLKGIEDSHDQFSFANQAMASTQVGMASIMSGITKLPALGANIAIKNLNDWRELFGQKRIEGVSYKNEYADFWDEAVHNYANKAPTASESFLNEAVNNKNFSRAGEIFALQFIQNAPQTIGLLGAAATGVGIPALIAVGGITASNKASELEGQGVDIQKATTVGVINGALEAGFESLGTFAPLKTWENAIAKEFGKQSGKEFLFNFGKTLAHTMGVNFGEEAATSFAQDFTDYASGVNPDAMKGSVTRMFEAGALGAATGGILVTPTGIAAGITKRSQIQQQQLNQKIYESIGQGTIDSKLAARLPKAHAEYLKQVVKDGPVQNIYMNAEGFSQYFQSKNINPNEMANELGITDSFNTAIENGTDVVIPTEVIAEKLAKTEHFEGLKEHVKFGPDQLSAYDVKIQETEAKRQLEIENESAREGKTPEEISTAEEAAKEVGKQVESQLKNAGYSPKQAKAQAKLYSEFFATQGLKSNQSPLDLFNKYGLNIQNVNTESSVSENIDTTEYFQASPQSKKLGIKFSATKINNKLSVNPLDTVSVSAELVDSGAGKTAVVDSLKTDAKYPGVSLDAIKSLEYAAARNGAVAMSVSAKRLGLKLNDKVIQNYADAGFTMSVRDGEAFFVKRLDPVFTYNQATISPIGFFSQVEYEIQKMDFTQMPPKDLINRIKNIQGLKKEELEYIGLEDFLNAKDGKVSKQEVLDFVRENGVQVEQVVLGDLAKPKVQKVDEKSQWGDEPDFKDTEWEEPSDDVVSDVVYNNWQDQLYEIEKGRDDIFNDYFEKAKADAQAELADGEDLSDDQIEEIREQVLEKRQEEFEEAESEYVRSEDYGYGVYKIYERVSGETLEGGTDSQEWSWYDGRRTHEYGYNEEEAKIQWTQDLIDAGHLKPVIDKPMKDEIKFSLEDDSNPEKLEYKMDLPDGIKQYDPDFEMTIQGNEKDGWEIDYNYIDDDGDRRHDMTPVQGGSTIDRAQQQAMQILSDIGYVYGYEQNPDQLELMPTKTQAELDAEKFAEQNKPTKSSKWKDHSVFGKKAGANYKEFLLTLPKTDGEFTYDTHFSGNKNFVAHARVSDINVDGKKTLFIEEIQSDWHQQGRESGYQTGDERAKIDELKEQSRQLRDKLDRMDEELNFDGFMKKEHPRVSEKTKDKAWANQSGKYFEAWKTFNKKIENARKVVEDQVDLINSEIKGLNAAVPDAPFKQTDAWASLVMKRMIRLAAEQGYEKVAWTPAKVHQDRWGTDNVSWVKRTGDETSKWTIKENKNGSFDVIGENGRTQIYMDLPTRGDAESFIERDKKPHWLVGSAEQRGGDADGMDIEELARQRGELLERKGERVETKDDLKKVIADTLNRERNDRSLESLTDRVWKMMESGDTSGEINPRAEGMEFFYNKLIPDVTKKILKKIDPVAKVEVSEIPELEKFGGKALSFDITETIRNKSLNEGFQLFQKNRGSITFGNNRKFNINLFNSKDESTFLHETGHFFLEVMSDLAKMENASAQIKQDYQTILNWLEVKPGEGFTVDQHEKFARGFESYLYEGKAPSDALRKAFHAFRQWLIAVYQSAVNLNVTVSPEMKGVFDRMLASDEQIDQAVETIGAKQLFDDPTKIGMNDQEALEYLNATAFAREDARDQLQAELMKDLIRKKDSAYKKRYNEIYDEVMAQAKEMPVFKAIEAIQGEFKLQKDMIDNQYSVFKGYLPNRSTTAVGFAPDFVASMFGFENGQAMLQAIAPVRRGLVDFVESQTVTRIKSEFPELLESPELTDEAIKAAHTEKYKRLKRLEMDYLLKNDQKVVNNVAAKLIRRLPSDEVVKKQSKEIVSKIKVSDLKPHLYRAAEKRYSNEAAKYFKQGEFGLAFEAKRKEYLNFELYKTAVDAQDEVKKYIKNFKKLFRADEKVAQGRDVDLVNAGRAILAQFGITKAEKTAEQYLAAMKEYDPESFTVVNGLVAAATENAGPYQQSTFEDFVEMAEAVMSIYDLAKSRKEIEIDGERRDVDEVINELNTQIASITPADQKKYKTTVDKFGIAKERLLGAKASLVRAEHWARAMDVKENGVFFRYVFRPISDATTKYRLKKNEVMKKYEAILRQYEKNLSPDAIPADELGFMFRNKAELMMAILHSGNESNLRKLLLGRGWGSVNPDNSLNKSNWDKFINRMHESGTLTKADYDMAQEIWDLLESIKPDAQKAHKQMFGYYFNEITANEIETPFGKYRGGYIPAKTDMHTVEDSAIRKEKEEFENNNNSFQFPTTGRGFTKSRVDNYTAALSLDMNMLGGHIDGVMRFSYIEPRVKEVSKVVLNKSFRAQLHNLDTNIAKDMLVPWLQRAAQQKMVLPASDGIGRMTDAVARVARKNVAMQIMFGGVTNTLQQFTGLIVAMSKVKPKYIRNGLWNLITDNKATVDSIMTKSEWMQSTQGSNVYDTVGAINDIILNPSTFEKFQNFSKKHTYFLQSAAQGIVNNAVWAGAYEQGIESGLTEKDAIKQADSAVRTTQGTNNPEDVSRFEQGTATELLFKQFVGYFNMLANLNASELVRIQRDVGLKKGAGRAFYLYVTALMLPAVLSDAIVKAMAGKFDEDDDDQYLDDIMMSFFGSQFKTIAATVPYAGQLGVAAWNKMFTKSPADDRLSLSPVLSIVEGTVVAPIQLYKEIADGNDVRKKTVKDTLQLMGIISGLPTGPIGKPVGYLMDVSNGDAQPTGPIDFTRGLVTGRNGK